MIRNSINLPQWQFLVCLAKVIRNSYLSLVFLLKIINKLRISKDKLCCLIFSY